MARGQRTCVTCGTKYSYCPQCAEDQNKPTWMFAWHDLECKNVWDIICKYKNGHVPKEETIKQLNGTITNNIKFTADIEDDIKNICFEENKAQETTKEPIEIPVVSNKHMNQKKTKRIVTEN